MDHTQEAEKKIKSLKKKIQNYNAQYYENHRSVVTDYTFDQLLAELQSLEQKYPQYQTQDSPTARVGGQVDKKYKTIAHQYPMLSLSNTYSEEEIKNFVARVKKLSDHPTTLTFVCELKFDGVAVSITYQNGLLKHAVTRGDGTQGDIITQHIQRIPHIPKKIIPSPTADLIEVRGEVFMPKAVFEKINQQRIQNQSTPWSNPRNTASGTLKTLNPQMVADRSLDVYFYALPTPLPHIKTHAASIQQLIQWKFRVSPTYTVCKDIEDIMDYIAFWEKKKREMPLDIDGIVIKVNEIAHQQKLNFTAKSPRWAIAYKYTPTTANTFLKKVSYQIGRTGVITPVAHIQPIHLAGTIVQKASLHNASYIKNLELHLEDKVTIAKGGDIIPKIIAVDKNQKRGEKHIRITFPIYCPACHTTLIRTGEEKNIFCPNHLHCTPQIKGKIAHYAQKKAMNIAALGNKTIDLLFEKKWISCPADLYDLSLEKICQLEGFQQLAAKNLLKGIDYSKKIPFEKVLFSLGIRYVGITAAKKLAQYFKNIDQLIRASFEKLMEVPDIGEKIAASVQNYFQKSDNINHILRLKNAGIQLEIYPENKTFVLKKYPFFQDKKMVISGVFEKYNRIFLKNKLEGYGSKVMTSITTKTDYLLIGHQPGARKISEAKKHHVKIIDEQALEKFFSDNER